MAHIDNTQVTAPSRVETGFPGLSHDGQEALLERCLQAVSDSRSIAEVAGITPVMLESLYRKGYEAYQSRDYDTAFEVFAGALLMQPLERRFHVGLGSTLLQTGLCREALPFFLYASTLQSDDPGAVFRIGECLLGVGEVEEALEAFSLTLELCQENGDDRLAALAQHYLDQLH